MGLYKLVMVSGSFYNLRQPIVKETALTWGKQISK